MQSHEFHYYCEVTDRQGKRVLFLGAIHGDYQHGWQCSDRYIPASYVYSLQIGKGAGYKNGITFFFARHTGSARWWKTYRNHYCRYTPFGFEIGFTRNGNNVPYVSH